jgi:hypothetical protein
MELVRIAAIGVSSSRKNEVICKFQHSVICATLASVYRTWLVEQITIVENAQDLSKFGFWVPKETSLKKVSIIFASHRVRINKSHAKIWSILITLCIQLLHKRKPTTVLKIAVAAILTSPEKIVNGGQIWTSFSVQAEIKSRNRQ